MKLHWGPWVKTNDNSSGKRDSIRPHTSAEEQLIAIYSVGQGTQNAGLGFWKCRGKYKWNLGKF